MVEIPHKDYFEGILQLRNHTPELLKWVKKTVKKDDRAMITKEKKVRGGLDLYFSSQRYLRAIGKKIKERFVGEFKQTRTLHTRSKMGKELYRVTVLFRLWPFEKGEIVQIRGEKYKILNFDNQIRVQVVSTGEKKTIKQEELKYVQT